MNGRHRQHRNALFLALALVCSGSGRSWALDRQPSPAQYSHQQWSAEDGFRLGQVSSIAQTPDGYLWVGGENGLVSFDGEKFRAFPTTGESALTHILGLAVDGRGALWVWMQGASILRQTRDGFVNVTNELGFPDEITVLSNGRRGSLLFSTLGRQLFEYRDGRVSKIGVNQVSPALALVEAGDGVVWAGTRDYGLGSLKNRTIVPLNESTGPRKINCLLRHGERGLWVGTDEGLFLWDGTRLRRVPGPPGFERTQVVCMVEDRDAHLWCGSDKGLFRVLESDSRRYIASGPFLNDSISALFEDREGGLWIGAAGTLQRWKDFAFQPVRSGSALLDAPVYADERGTVWAASPRGGLYRVSQSGATEEYRPDILGRDVIYALSGRPGSIWVGRRDGGATHLRQTAGGLSAETFTTADGLAENTVLSVYEAPNGTVWAGTLNGGLSRYDKGHWSTFTTAHGLPSNSVSAICEDNEAALWIGTPGGLASFAQGHWRVYSAHDGLPANDISSILPDADAEGHPMIWVGTTKGLALLHSGKIRIMASQSGILDEPILGLTKDLAGNLWVSTPDHLLRVNRAQLLDEAAQSVSTRLYGRRDGVERPGGSRRMRSLVTDVVGRIWAATRGGLRVTSPAYVRHRAVSTIVHIESVVGDNGGVDLRAPSVPAPQRRIVFNFNGLNFDARERIRFRYQLDGYDQGWNEPVESRQAVYTHLDPATYRFRVIATNTEGEWNFNETSVSLRIEPALWQTWWFRSVCFVVALLLSWVAYRVRMRQISAQNLLVFEGRVAERMRIAQDLHDTLLQSFHALMLRFQAASNTLPHRPDHAKELLDVAIDRAADALAESRHAVQKLRASSLGSTDLAEAITRVGHELRDVHAGLAIAPSFRVLVEGTPRTVNPLVRDDLYRIAREAIGNAFRHASARQVEVELRYESHVFALRVRDDGVGMESRLLARGGRSGHWGLPGMREHTRGLGGRFTVWSELHRGTEIEAAIPGRVAYRVIDEASEDGIFDR